MYTKVGQKSPGVYWVWREMYVSKLFCGYKDGREEKRGSEKYKQNHRFSPNHPTKKNSHFIKLAIHTVCGLILSIYYKSLLQFRDWIFHIGFPAYILLTSAMQDTARYCCSLLVVLLFYFQGIPKDSIQQIHFKAPFVVAHHEKTGFHVEKRR